MIDCNSMRDAAAIAMLAFLAACDKAPPPTVADEEAAEANVEAAILADPNLTADQRDSLLAVYRNFVAANDR